MADKSFGVEQLDIFGTGTPTIQSPTDLNLNANTVAISTNFSVGGRVSIASGIVTASSGVVTYYGDGQYLTGVSGGGGGITTAATNVQVTYSVTSDGNNLNWRFTGPGNNGTDNDPDLYLVRGQRYRFINNSGGSHPFYIKTTNITGSGNQYTDGVTNNGATSGNVDFNVQHDAPSRLFYQCGNHASMNGNLYITGGANWQLTDAAAFETPEIFTLLNVGIGTDNPTSQLDVGGDAKISGVVTATSFVGSTRNILTQNTTLTGASMTFDGIPSWATKITVNLHEASLSGSDQIYIRLRAGGSTITSDYDSTSGNFQGNVISARTDAFNINTTSAAHLTSGSMVIEKIDSAGLIHVQTNAFRMGTNQIRHGVGELERSSGNAVDGIEITSQNTDTLDGGVITIYYE